ncbi:MAG: metal ABC transporter permease, partial [Ilumatobacteraceae bacterium]
MTWLTDPIGWWIDPFVDNAFMREALLATVLAVACTSVIGTWVVLRGLAFLGDALAHGVLPGIAIAWVIGIDTSIGAIIAALAMVGGVAVIKQGSPLPDDVSIGVLFVGFLALAVVIMSAGAATGDLTRFLFGSINAVDGTDLARLGIVTAVVLTAVAIGHRALLVSTFDPLQARLGGLHPRATHLLLLALVALAIVASFETVGSLLV